MPKSPGRALQVPTPRAVWKDTAEKGLPSRASFLHPINVHVAARSDIEREQLAFAEYGDGARVAPFADFGVAVREGETARPVVITGGVIDNFLRLGGESGHINHEVAVVDAVLAFIEEDKGHRWAGVGHVPHLEVRSPANAVLRARQVPELFQPGPPTQLFMLMLRMRGTLRPPGAEQGFSKGGRSWASGKGAPQEYWFQVGPDLGTYD